MPRKIEKPEISDDAAQLIADSIPGDPIEREAWLHIQLGVSLADLVGQIPRLDPRRIPEYIAAVAAAIAAGAITPDVGRAMLYAGQLAIAARSSSSGRRQR
jgi:hypothetical protein